MDFNDWSVLPNPPAGGPSHRSLALMRDSRHRTELVLCLRIPMQAEQRFHLHRRSVLLVAKDSSRL